MGRRGADSSRHCFGFGADAAAAASKGPGKCRGCGAVGMIRADGVAHISPICPGHCASLTQLQGEIS